MCIILSIKYLKLNHEYFLFDGKICFSGTFSGKITVAKQVNFCWQQKRVKTGFILSFDNDWIEL